MALLRRLVREPLLHFVLLGGALFALEAATGASVEDDSHVIVISPDFVRVLGRRAEAAPDADPEGLVRSYVHDEALYREARRIGLDEGDVIVRRRLIQKMEYLLRGLADIPEPSDADLETFLKAHASLFESPPRVWFQEVYFASRDRGPDAQARAVQALDELSASVDDPAPERRGDPRPGGYGAQGVTHAQLVARRSQAFADAVFAAPLDRWSGPIDADLGSHLVRVSQRTEASVPALAAVRGRVREALLEDARDQACARAAEAVVDRYRLERTTTAEARP